MFVIANAYHPHKCRGFPHSLTRNKTLKLLCTNSFKTVFLDGGGGGGGFKKDEEGSQ